jgi:hypothetical protein
VPRHPGDHLDGEVVDGVAVEAGAAVPVRHGGGARSAGAARAAELEEHGGAPGLSALGRSLVAEADRPLRATLLTLLGVALLSVVVLRLGYVKATART